MSEIEKTELFEEPVKRGPGRPKGSKNQSNEETNELEMPTEELEIPTESDEEEVDEDLLFPAGPTIEDVEEWKSRYNGEVFLTDFEDGEIYLWRPINRKEYKSIMAIEGSTGMYREEAICQTVILWPKGNISTKLRTFGKAGVPTLLSELILEKSGYNPNTQTIRL